MGTVTTLPHSRPLTRSDLTQVPDDGHRYELVEGTLVVTPAPSPQHQFVVGRLYVELLDACPQDLRVAFAPLDVALDERTVLQPDLLVARRTEFTERDLPTAPLLVVEVLSPSTRLVDVSLKHARYESAGCPSYWVVDPDEPSLLAWELQAGRYVEQARVAADETFATGTPFAVSITPSDLVD